MSTLATIDAKTLSERLARREVTLVDIREPDEFAREHIAGAVSLPLSKLDEAHVTLETHGDVVFHCRSGMRTDSNCARLAAHVDGPAFTLTGGLEAWKRAGLPVRSDANAPLEIMRQVQITAGSLVLLGVVLGVLANPLFYALSGFIGAGLLFAGTTGWCGMAMLLARAPWNRRAA